MSVVPGVLMIPTPAGCTICFIVAFRGRPPPVDIDGIRELVAGSLDVRATHHLRCCCSPSRQTHRPALLPVWEAASLEKCCNNGGPYQLVIFHFLSASSATWGREWELSLTASGMRPGICVATAPLWRLPRLVFLIYPFGQEFRSLIGCPSGISRHLSIHVGVPSEHNS